MVRHYFDAHKLYGCKSNQRPTMRIFLDVETHINKTPTGTDLPLRIACTRYEDLHSVEKGHKFKDTVWYDYKSLWEYIISKHHKGSRLVVITHNAGFDMLASCALPFLTEAGYKLTFLYDKGMVYIMSCSKNKQKLQVISNTNFYPTSIKKLGDMLDLPKLECDIDNATDEELIPYCQRDVEILYQSYKRWEAMIYKNNLGMARMTKASQAFTAFTHRFMTYGIYAHTFKPALTLERESYCGGRCEALKIGKFTDGPFIQLDFNSNYAYVMKMYAYPTRLCYADDQSTFPEFLRIVEGKSTIAKVRIKTDMPVYPIKRNGKLIFPVGEFETVLCDESLKYAIAHGHVIDNGVFFCYEINPIFVGYVNYFYGKKAEAQDKGNMIDRTIFKDLLNSLYGKFAEQHPTVQMVDSDDPRPCSTELVTVSGEPGYKMVKTIMGKTMVETGMEDTRHTFTAISSFVTDHARMLLWKVIEQVGWDRVYYMDTDCVIIKEADMARITYPINDTELGALSVEGRADEIEIRAPKDYTFGDKCKRKGIPARAIEVSPDVFEYDEFQGVASRTRQNDVTQAATRTVQKKPSYDITKGKKQADGRVIPFDLPGDEGLL